jgi:predicted DCC family thiol-disulfide oxidoreductase YuxK
MSKDSRVNSSPPGTSWPLAPARHVILFDGVCELCNTGADWIRERDRADRFEFLAYQSDEARRRFPALDPERLAEAMHVVAPDGAVRAGVDAAPWIFGNLPGWKWVARILGFPPLRALARPVYRLIARRRITATCGSGTTTPSRARSRP